MSDTRWHALAMLAVVGTAFGLQFSAWNARRKGLPEATRIKLQMAGLTVLVLGIALHQPPNEIPSSLSNGLGIALAFAFGIAVGALSAALPKSNNSEQ